MRGKFSVLVLAALAFSSVTSAQQNSASGSPQERAATPVHKISLPQYPPELPDGPGKQVFQRNCLICHSARYITTQPRFSRETWQKEVQKMIASYGAQIAPKDQEPIVNYLVSIRGTPEAAKAAPTAPHTSTSRSVRVASPQL